MVTGMNDIHAVEVIFGRPYFILQPVHKIHIVGITAEYRHGNMIVGIDKPGQSQHVVTVEHFIIGTE